MKACGKKFLVSHDNFHLKISFRLLDWEVKNLAQYSIASKNYMNIMKGFQKLNDISQHISTAFTFQLVVLTGQAILLAIYAVFGYFKYYQSAFKYLRVHFYMVFTIHGLVIHQCFLNDSTSVHVSCFRGF